MAAVETRTISSVHQQHRRHRRDPEKIQFAGGSSPSTATGSSRPRYGSVTRQCTRGLLSLYMRLAPEVTEHSANRSRLEAFAMAPRGEVAPRRLLTLPPKGAARPAQREDGDNDETDLICRAGDELEAFSGSPEGRVSFEVVDKLGKGSFGQVFRCLSAKTGRLVAIKIVKSKHAYRHQATVEAQLARKLSARRNPHIVEFLGDFEFRNHVCLVFEALSMNMYELLKQNQFRGLPLNSVRLFTRQIVAALKALDETKIVHCDLKPENILLVPFGEKDEAGAAASSVVKVIDFGSACYEGRPTQSYVQSRFYRAPEVLVGAPYDCSVDVWSCACVSAELMVGLPIFPGTSSHDQLVRIVDMFGPPPDLLLQRGADTPEFFKVSVKSTQSSSRRALSYQLKTPEEFAMDNRSQVRESKKYFEYRKLAKIIAHYPVRGGMRPDEVAKVKQGRVVFAHFLKGMLQYAPQDRWTPSQALAHPFLSEDEEVQIATTAEELQSWCPPKCRRADERRLFGPWGGVSSSSSSSSSSALSSSLSGSPSSYAVSPSQVARERASRSVVLPVENHSTPSIFFESYPNDHSLTPSPPSELRFDKRVEASFRAQQPPRPPPRGVQSGLARQLAASSQPTSTRGRMARSASGGNVPSMLMPPPPPGAVFGDMDGHSSPAGAGGNQHHQHHQSTARGTRRGMQKRQMSTGSMGAIDECLVPIQDRLEGERIDGRGPRDEGLPLAHQADPAHPLGYISSLGPSRTLQRRMLSLQSPQFYNAQPYADFFGNSHGYAQQHWQAYQQQQLQQQQHHHSLATQQQQQQQHFAIRRNMTLTAAQWNAAAAAYQDKVQRENGGYAPEGGGLGALQHDGTIYPPPQPRLSSSYSAPMNRQEGYQRVNAESDFSSALQRPKHQTKQRSSGGSSRRHQLAQVVWNVSSAPDFGHQSAQNRRRSSKGGHR